MIFIKAFYQFGIISPYKKRPLRDAVDTKNTNGYANYAHVKISKITGKISSSNTAIYA